MVDDDAFGNSGIPQPRHKRTSADDDCLFWEQNPWLVIVGALHGYGMIPLYPDFQFQFIPDGNTIFPDQRYLRFDLPAAADGSTVESVQRKTIMLVKPQR